MSLMNEALPLKNTLMDLQRRGEQLLMTGPSMEQASHFAELTQAYISGYIDRPSLEAQASAEDYVQTSLEGLGAVIRSLTVFLTKRKDAAETVNKSTKAKILSMSESVAKAYGNEAWLDKAVFQEGEITVGGAGGNYFFRGEKKVDNFIAEARKDLAEYSKILGQLKSPCTAFTQWAADTVKAILAAEASGEDAVAAAAKRQLAKQPKSPADVVKVPSAARLGQPTLDVWTETYDWSALNPKVSIWIEDEPSGRGHAKLKPLNKAEVLEAVKLLDDVAKLLQSVLADQDSFNSHADIIEQSESLSDTVREGVYQAPANVRLCEFDSWYLVVIAAYSKLYHRLVDLEIAIFDYIRESIKTKP